MVTFQQLAAIVGIAIAVSGVFGFEFALWLEDHVDTTARHTD